jgi:hypothetical protein
MRRLMGATVLVAILAASLSEARVKPPRTAYGTGVEKKDVGPLVPSKVVEKKVAKLTTQINWQSSLDEAKAEAKKKNKPIFWLHALGDLDGEC